VERLARLWWWLVFFMVGCAVPVDEAEEEGENLGVAMQALSTFDCHSHQETGYEAGQPFPITVVTIDGELVERNTANAYYFMAKQAAAAGVQIRIVSGFRSNAEQQYLYNCYINCNCNNCNLAAQPGYSNHQSGEALDLNTSASGVYNWLAAHADEHGFERTVSSEPWHWEYRGPKPVGGPCGTLEAELVKVTSNAPEDPSGEADFVVCPGDPFEFRVEMRNVGTARWADLEADAKYVGERVRLMPKGVETDALTGAKKASVLLNLNKNVLPASWGGGAGEACNDHGGCRRTVFTKDGLAGTAPSEPGIYKSSWRLRDYSPHWSEFKAFGPTVDVAFRVDDCPGASETPGTPGEDGDPVAEQDDPSVAPEPSAAEGEGCALGGSGDPRLVALVALLWLVRRRLRSAR